MRYKRVFSLIIILFFLFFTMPGYALGLTDILGMVNWDYMDLTVIGLCVGPSGVVGILIMYWEPALLIETVKRPGETIIEPLGSIVSSLTAEVTKNLMYGVTELAVPISSGSTSSRVSGTNLQFNEAHVYEFPFRGEIMLFIDIQCPDKLPTGSFIKYLSELDFLEWRIGIIEAMHPKSMVSGISGPAYSVLGGYVDDLYMGFWGATYPRRGFFTHQSQVVGSAVAAARAVSIAGLLGSTSHLVIEGIGFIPSFKDDKLQLIYPKPSGCIKIGENPAFWESGKLSSEGNYLWIYWRRRICCIY